MKQTLALCVISAVLAFVVACHSQAHSEARLAQPQETSKARPVQPQETSKPQDVTVLCEQIKNIEMLPHKKEPVADAAYNAIASAGEDVIPCLIGKITDETMMKDPRSVPKVGNVAVGDTAFFLLADVAKIDQAGFVALLPPDVRKAYEGDEGIYGYFRLIDENNNRQKLQAAAVKWYENKYGRRWRESK